MARGVDDRNRHRPLVLARFRAGGCQDVGLHLRLRDLSGRKGAKIVEDVGGEAKDWQELRALQIALPDLKKHVDWLNEVRAFLKTREAGLKVHEALLQLDYGGFTDSVNKKVSCWSASVIVQGRLVEHFDFFFDQAPKKEKDNGKGDPSKARKDGQSGVFFLHELLDPKSLDRLARPRVSWLWSGLSGNKRSHRSAISRGPPRNPLHGIDQCESVKS